jgi:ACS family hexuronate transporter-like MFS transporter
VSSNRAGRYRWVVAFLLFLAAAINYLDRAALGVAAPLMSKDLGLSPSQLGLIFSTFFIGYALCAFIGGQLADRYGPRRVYAWAAVSWSLLCALTGVVRSFTQLFMVRALFGFAEGPMVSTTNRMITNWFPREETGRAIGFSFSGQMVGGSIAAPIVGFLALAYGWRMAFFAIGALGLIWVIAWRHLVTDLPRDNAHATEVEIRRIEISRSAGTAPVQEGTASLRPYLLRPSTLALGLGLFALNYTIYIFLSWLPSYLIGALHLDMAQMSLVAAIPWACGFVGFTAGGVIADMAYGRFSDRLTARKIMTVAPLGLSAFPLIGLNVATNVASAVALIALAVMLVMMSVQALFATLHELVPEAHMGGVGGFIHLLSNISGIIGPIVTGVAVQHFGGYGSAFVIAGVIALVGALAMTLLVTRQENLRTGA